MVLLIDQCLDMFQQFLIFHYVLNFHCACIVNDLSLFRRSKSICILYTYVRTNGGVPYAYITSGVTALCGTTQGRLLLYGADPEEGTVGTMKRFFWTWRVIVALHALKRLLRFFIESLLFPCCHLQLCTLTSTQIVIMYLNVTLWKVLARDQCIEQLTCLCFRLL